MTYKNPTPTEVINYLSDYYDQFGSLPTNYVECQETGISYTAFGTNLQKKIAKAGSIKELLSSFTGRGVIKKTAKKAVDQVVTNLKKKASEARTPVTISVSETATA